MTVQPNNPVSTCHDASGRRWTDFTQVASVMLAKRHGNWPALTSTHTVRAHWQSLTVDCLGRRCRGCMADWPWCMTHSTEVSQKLKHMSLRCLSHWKILKCSWVIEWSLKVILCTRMVSLSLSKNSAYIMYDFSYNGWWCEQSFLLSYLTRRTVVILSTTC